MHSNSMRAVRLPTVCVVAATRCQLPGGMVPGGTVPGRADPRWGGGGVWSWRYGPRVGTVAGGAVPGDTVPGFMVQGDIVPALCGQTDTCENISCPQLRWWVVITTIRLYELMEV